MQEDKEQVFDAADSIELAVDAMAGMIADLQVDEARMGAAAGAGFATATDLADWLVRRLNLPFREAHHVTGRVVKLAEDRGIGLEDLGLADLREIHPGIEADALEVLGVAHSVASRLSHGGTAPIRVREAASLARKRFLLP